MFSSFLYAACIKGIPCLFLIFLLFKVKKMAQAPAPDLGIGKKIITRGGLLGTVCHLRQETVIVQVYDGTRVEILKTAVTSVAPDA